MENASLEKNAWIVFRFPNGELKYPNKTISSVNDPFEKTIVEESRDMDDIFLYHDYDLVKGPFIRFFRPNGSWNPNDESFIELLKDFAGKNQMIQKIIRLALDAKATSNPKNVVTYNTITGCPIQRPYTLQNTDKLCTRAEAIELKKSYLDMIYAIAEEITKCKIVKTSSVHESWSAGNFLSSSGISVFRKAFGKNQGIITLSDFIAFLKAVVKKLNEIHGDFDWKLISYMPHPSIALAKLESS